jgi:hypothetical protein
MWWYLRIVFCSPWNSYKLSTDIETLQWQAGARKSTSDLDNLRFEFAAVGYVPAGYLA